MQAQARQITRAHVHNTHIVAAAAAAAAVAAFAAFAAFASGSSNTVVVLIRGECFRSGGHQSRHQSGDVPEQLDAIDSLFRCVVQPATQVAGWRVVVAADVFMRSWKREEKVQ